VTGSCLLFLRYVMLLPPFPLPPLNTRSLVTSRSQIVSLIIFSTNDHPRHEHTSYLLPTIGCHFCLHTPRLLWGCPHSLGRALIMSGYSHISEACASCKTQSVLVSSMFERGRRSGNSSEGRQRKYPHVFAHSEQVCDITSEIFHH